MFMPDIWWKAAIWKDPIWLIYTAGENPNPLNKHPFLACVTFGLHSFPWLCHCEHGALITAHYMAACVSAKPSPDLSPPSRHKHTLLRLECHGIETWHVPCEWILTCYGKLQNDKALLAHLAETAGSERSERAENDTKWMHFEHYLWNKGDFWTEIHA